MTNILGGASSSYPDPPFLIITELKDPPTNVPSITASFLASIGSAGDGDISKIGATLRSWNPEPGFAATEILTLAFVALPAGFTLPGMVNSSPEM